MNIRFAGGQIRLGGALFYLSVHPTLFYMLVGVAVGISVLSLETFSQATTGLEISEMFLL